MKMHDERVLQLNNKIQSEAYRLALFLSGGSVFIKTYVLHMSFGQYAVELGILIFTTIYIVVRSMLLGSDFVNSSKKGKIMAMVGGFILCLAASVVSGIRNYTLYGDHYTGILDGHFIAAVLFTFFSSAVFVSAALLLLFWCNKKGQERIEKMLMEDSKQDE